MFELALDPATWALLCAVALAAGFIDAIAGGGGMLTVPALLTDSRTSAPSYAWYQ